MRSYIVQDMGYDKFQKRVCQIHTTRDVAGKLYEVLLDGKATLLIETLTRRNEGFLEVTFTPLADDANVTDIRQVVDIVHGQTVTGTEDGVPEGSFFSSRIISVLRNQPRANVPSLAPPKQTEDEESVPEETEVKEEEPSGEGTP